MFWTCPCLNLYRVSILKVLSDITGQILLGATSLMKVSKNHLKFIRISLITANKCIAMHWKDISPPTHARWTNERAYQVKRLCTT